VALVVLQVATIVVFGAITATRYPLWSVVDEGAHYDNVLWIAEHGSLPVLGQTPASEQELAIGQGLYPRHSTIDVSTAGLTGLSYEAFQPPLYYVVASPVFHLSGDYRTKAYLLRFFGLALLLAAAALLARLSRWVLKERWLVGLSVGLLVLMMPGVITRAVTISNVSLAFPLVIACVTEIWIAWETTSTRRLVGAGALLGLCVLTDLYLVELVPVFVLGALCVLWRRRTRTDALWAGAGGLVAILVVLPWVVFNEIHYHSLTASALAKREQLAVVNPHHLRDTVGAVPGLTVENLFTPLMPQEWGSFLPAHPFLGQLATDFEALLIAGSLVLAVALGRRLVTTGYWILLLPWVMNLLACWYIDLDQQWLSGSMVARYTYPTLPLLALFAAAAALTVLRTPRVVLMATAASSVFLVALWISLVPIIHAT
jgi:4-amino-4-deoxy-L-arabinose transferase-like glycosyltransferase